MVDYGPLHQGIDWTQTNSIGMIEFQFGPIGDKATKEYFKSMYSPYLHQPYLPDISSDRYLTYQIHKDYSLIFADNNLNALQEFIEVSLEVEKTHLAIGMVLSEMQAWLESMPLADEFDWNEVFFSDLINAVFTSFSDEGGSMMGIEWPESLPKIEPFVSLLNLFAFLVKLLVGTVGFTIIYSISIITHMFQLIIFGRGKNLIAGLGDMVEDALTETFKKMNVMFKSTHVDVKQFGIYGEDPHSDRVWKISPLDFPSAPFEYSEYEIILGYEKLRGLPYEDQPSPVFSDLKDQLRFAQKYFVNNHMRPVLAMPDEDNPNSQVYMYYWDNVTLLEKGNVDEIEQLAKNPEDFTFRLERIIQKRTSYDIIRYCPNLIKTDYTELPHRHPNKVLRNIVFIEGGYIEKENSIPLTTLNRTFINSMSSLNCPASDVLRQFKIKKGGYIIKPDGDDRDEGNLTLGEHNQGVIRGMKSQVMDETVPYGFYPTQLLFTIYGFRPHGFLNWYRNPLRYSVTQKKILQPSKDSNNKDKQAAKAYNPTKHYDWANYNPLPPAAPEPEPAPAPPRPYGFGGYYGANPVRPPRARRDNAGWDDNDWALYEARRRRARNENPEE